MDNTQWLADSFEANRDHLEAVAYRMLGSLAEASDAVQEAWLRLSRSDTERIENLGGWLTTVVARICLDMLRSRSAERAEPMDTDHLERIPGRERTAEPEQETALADSVGLALLVVLDTLSPAERLAFVLHDLFGMPFDEIAPVIERSEVATRKLASRARRRVRGARSVKNPDLAGQHRVADAFLAASREGSFEALLEVLDPNIVFRADLSAISAGASEEMRGADAVARFFSGRAVGARAMLIDGAVGVVVPRRNRLYLALMLTIIDGKIVGIEAVADPERLRRMQLGVLEG